MQVEKIRQHFLKIDPLKMSEIDQAVVDLCDKYEAIKVLVESAFCEGYTQMDYLESPYTLFEISDSFKQLKDL